MNINNPIRDTVNANRHYIEISDKLNFFKGNEKLLTGFPRYQYTKESYKKEIQSLENQKEDALEKFRKCVDIEIIYRNSQEFLTPINSKNYNIGFGIK
ncbi:hypothetical protein UFOVP144_38 [uncultured Caudovirales phage]|uniref:Uncharacterized protein n=1 Tax=uncultured Caudovirales phage TaxID=2100421 RepID=A0A6J7XPT8_9CAUD|nr:hypothetical protein UFOVP144_38 [uncultured Caudovirales phage]